MWYSRCTTGVKTTAEEASMRRNIYVCNGGFIVTDKKRIDDDLCLAVRIVADEFDVV